MGYELTAHLDLSIEEPVAFIERWIGLMATEDVARIELSQQAPGDYKWVDLLAGGAEVLAEASSIVRGLPPKPVVTAVEARLRTPSSARRLVLILASHGPGYFARWQVSDQVRRDLDLIIDLEDAEWEGRVRRVGPAGPAAFVFDLVEEVCRLGPVRRAHALQEQMVSNPLVYTLAFHDRPAGFCADLRDVVTLAYKGGAGHYTDARKDDPPLVQLGASSILFCDRTRPEVERIKARLLSLRPRVEARPLPEDTSREVIEAAAAASGYVTFTTPEGGIGVRHREAGFDGFLDDFYLDLIERLL